MAYNFSLKEYANGTLQLTYYDNSICTEFDNFRMRSVDGSTPFDGYRFDEITLPPAEYDELHESEFGFYTPWGDYVEPENCQKTFPVAETSSQEPEMLSEEELLKRRERSVNSSLNRTIHKIYDLGRNNVWEWFLTFTLNESAVKNRCDYDECSSKVRKWFNNMRSRKCPDIKYLIIPEKHPSSGAWHFHALVSNCNGLEFRIAENNQEFRKDEHGNVMLDKKGQPIRNKYFGDKLRVSYPDGNYIYNIVDFDEKRYGFTTATKITDTRKTVSYVIKYLTKELAECTFGKKRFFYSMNLEVPSRRLFFSDKLSLEEIIEDIEANFNVRLLKDYIKTVKINNFSYQNTVSYLEFEKNVSQTVPDLPGAAE